ncbi:ABC transporter ATP-binding protein [Lacrimispora xylanolytica]|uniref:ABC transporter ATP-binding protein n=1 Tax=Lacrimispora xylanolytica TaxID=29375 RepID=A0ABY7A9S6_9FIRM|nr:ABC transporter ATP-binding protein [Lacrimispora xylanolytica]WAJ22649.1 ABC transporter ATP-binding protein [Lacrimispora xylanolytica]
MIKTLMKSIREYKRASILTPLYITLEIILECLLPLVMANLIDKMTGQSMIPIIRYGIMLIIMAMLSLLFGYMSGRIGATASCGFAKNLRQDVFFKIQDFSFADIDKFSTSSLVTRMTTDVTNVQNAYQMIIRIAVRTPLMLIFSVILSLTISVKMSLIFLIMIPFAAVALFSIVFTVFPIFKRIFKKYDAMNNSVQENIQGIRVVKSFVREDYERERFQKAAADVCKEFTRAEKIIALNNPILMFCISLAIFLVSFIGAKTIINSGATELTTGQLSSLINYGVQILSSLMMLSMVFVICSMAKESANRICEVLNHESTLTSPINGVMEVKNGSIQFENVSFSYSEKSKKPALVNINLDIKSGQTIGILGGTGSSKTSLIQLISRLYDVTEGKVCVSGVDVRNYDLESLRDEVAVVLQKNVLFSGTIKENLRWGKKDASDEELVRVCKLAQADEFIQQFPDKYDTYIEQGGTNVSGGQKQRLCIARALLKKPKILILDDSTSAVDTKTDAMIRKALREEIPETTKIIIAQRTSSLEDADQIIVLDGGKVSEQGTHEELLAQKGIYYEVYQSQTNGKKED